MTILVSPIFAIDGSAYLDPCTEKPSGAYPGLTLVKGPDSPAGKDTYCYQGLAAEEFVSVTPGQRVHSFLNRKMRPGITVLVQSPIVQDYWVWHLEKNGDGNIILIGLSLTGPIVDSTGKLLTFKVRVALQYR